MDARISAGLAKKTTSELRSFALTVGAALAVLGAIAFWRDRLWTALVLCGVSTLLTLSGLTVPDVLAPVERAWMALARVMSKVTTPVFMGIVYFLVFTPFGVVRRLFGANSLTRKHRDSAWIAATPSTGTSGLEHQF